MIADIIFNFATQIGQKASGPATIGFVQSGKNSQQSFIDLCLTVIMLWPIYADTVRRRIVFKGAASRSDTNAEVQQAMNINPYG